MQQVCFMNFTYSSWFKTTLERQIVETQKLLKEETPGSIVPQHVGWNDVASSKANDKAAEGDLQLSGDGSVVLKQTLKSFTPINIGAISTWDRGFQRARSRELDRDMLYDLPDLPLPGLSAVKKKGQSSRRPARPRKVSSSILLHPWINVVENGSPQLCIPPDSMRSPSNPSSTQVELFSRANITKPLLDLAKPVTTEDVLKSKSVSLGQTTMEKLAYYRFHPVAHHLTEAKESGDTDSTEGFVVEGNLPEELHDAISYEQEQVPSIYISYGYATACQNQVEFQPVLNKPGPINYKEDEFGLNLGDENPFNHDEQNSPLLFDEGGALGLSGDVDMPEAEQVNMSQQEITPVVEPVVDDDFPIDDDLETEMAGLLMPDKIYQRCFMNYLQPVLLREDSRSIGTSLTHFQAPSPDSHAAFDASTAATNVRRHCTSFMDSILYNGTNPMQSPEAMEWQDIHEGRHQPVSIGDGYRRPCTVPFPDHPPQEKPLAEGDEYSPLKPFARPEFPKRVQSRSFVTGISSGTILRTCFRIGEALREGALCECLKQDAIIELFARVRESVSDPVTPSKLYFVFADLFHDRPPFMSGTLENNKISSLQETESRMLLGANGFGSMIRCLGRLKRKIAGPPGWMLYIINIRPTDWEEVRWTRGIAGAGMAK